MNTFAQALQTAISLCVAAKTVTEENAPVGFLYREAPVFENDSGWRFFSGGETDEYADDTANFTVCALSEITKNNPALAALLDEPEGGAWESGENGEFQAVADWQPQD